MRPLLLGGARLLDGSVVDVTIKDGLVVDAASHDAATWEIGADVEDLDGYLLLPAPAEPHTHLDKALTGERVTPTYDGLTGAARTWQQQAVTVSRGDVLRRGRDTLRELLWSGATAVRTHVNRSCGEDPLLALRALVELRETVADVMSLQVVYLSSKGSSPGELRSAVSAGADLLGGAPHTAADPAAAQAAVLVAAGQTGVDVDLHTDEELDPAARALAALVRQVLSSGFVGRVTASHCVSLGTQTPTERADTIAGMSSAGIGVVALPSTNLYLQGRALPGSSSPRGIAPLRELLDAEILVAGRIMGLPPAGPAAGLRADLLAIRATSLTDAIARAPQDRLVISAGRVVARSSVRRETQL
jgi:cytosine deaminase